MIQFKQSTKLFLKDTNYDLKNNKRGNVLNQGHLELFDFSFITFASSFRKI